MKVLAYPFTKPRWWLLALGAGALLLGLLWYLFGAGPGVTSDSFAYLAAAGSLRHSGALLNQNGTPYTLWAPLYPVLLSLGVGYMAVWVGVLNCSSLLAALGAWSWVAWRIFRGSYLAVILIAAMGVAVPWLATAKFVWSEPVFIGLFAAYVAALYGYQQEGRRSWLLAASVAGLLLPLQRTSGLFLLLGSAIGMLLAYPDLWRARPWLWLLHVAGCGSGGVAWLVHARRVATYHEAFKSRGWQGLRETFGDYGYVLARWLVPVQQSGWPKHCIFELLLPLLLLVLGYTAWKGGRELRWLGTTVLFYLLCHLATTIMSRSAGNVYDAERYAAAVYVPFLIVVAAGVQRGVAARPWAVVLLYLWLLYPMMRAARVAHFFHQMPATQVSALR